MQLPQTAVEDWQRGHWQAHLPGGLPDKAPTVSLVKRKMDFMKHLQMRNLYAEEGGIHNVVNCTCDGDLRNKEMLNTKVAQTQRKHGMRTVINRSWMQGCDMNQLCKE